MDEAAAVSRVSEALGLKSDAPQTERPGRMERADPEQTAEDPQVRADEIEDTLAAKFEKRFAEQEGKQPPKASPTEPTQPRGEKPTESNEIASDETPSFTQSELLGIIRHDGAVARHNTELQRFQMAQAQIERLPDGQQKFALRMQLHEESRRLQAQFSGINRLKQSLTQSIDGRKIEKSRQSVQSAFPDLDTGALRDYMKTSFGFTDRDIEAARDPRVFMMMEKARRYDLQQTQARLFGPSNSAQRGANKAAPVLSKNQQIEQRVASQFTQGKPNVVGVRSSDPGFKQQLAAAKTPKEREKAIERTLAKRFGA